MFPMSDMQNRYRFYWYQIPALIRAALYSKPVSGVHVTKMVICDWSLVVVYLFVCCWARPGPSCKLVKHTPGVSDKTFVIEHNMISVLTFTYTTSHTITS